MEQRGVGEYTIKYVRGKFQFEKILMPDCASGAACRHFHERGTPIQADGLVPEFPESKEVASGTTAQIENVVGAVALNVSEQRVDVLADVVVLCAFQKILG